MFKKKDKKKKKSKKDSCNLQWDNYYTPISTEYLDNFSYLANNHSDYHSALEGAVGFTPSTPSRRHSDEYKSLNNTLYHTLPDDTSLSRSLTSTPCKPHMTSTPKPDSPEPEFNIPTLDAGEVNRSLQALLLANTPKRRDRSRSPIGRSSEDHPSESTSDQEDQDSHHHRSQHSIDARLFLIHEFKKADAEYTNRVPVTFPGRISVEDPRRGILERHFVNRQIELDEINHQRQLEEERRKEEEEQHRRRVFRDNLRRLRDEMATADAVKELTKQLNTLSLKLDKFSSDEESSQSIDSWLDDLEQYAEETGRDEKYLLRYHLKGQAKEFLKEQDLNARTYEELKELLKQRFALTDTQKSAQKAAMFQMKQQPGETYPSFVSSIISKGRKLGLTDPEKLSIALSGAAPSIKPFLISAQPENITKLLQLPVARSESICSEGKEYVAMAEMVAQMSAIPNQISQQLEKMSTGFGKKVSFQDSPRESRKRYREPRHDSSRDSSSESQSDRHRQGRQNRRSNSNYFKNSCSKCGMSRCLRHQTGKGDCIAYGQICGYCGFRNHFASVCRFKRNNQRQDNFMQPGPMMQNNQFHQNRQMYMPQAQFQPMPQNYGCCNGGQHNFPPQQMQNSGNNANGNQTNSNAMNQQ